MASGLTPTYLLPYPLQTDPVNVASDVEDLATAVETELLLKAPLSSPAFTGTPAAPTAASDTNTTQIATTQFVVNQGYLKSSTAASTYAPLTSPSLTGNPTAPTASLGTNTTQIATTAFVQNELDSFVTLPVQTGNNGRFLTTTGTEALWKEIQTTDVSGLQTILNSLPATYAPASFTVIARAASFTLDTTMLNNLVMINNSSSVTITLPSDATAAFAVGSSIAFCRQTASAASFAAGSGVTGFLYTPGLSIRAQGSFVTAVKYAANSWLITGDLV